MFTLQQYEILLAIHQKGQVTKVAKQLQLSQPTITFHIRKMEEQSALPLFEQRGRHTTLSSVGQALLPFAEKIHQLHDQAKKTLEDIHFERKGMIQLGVSNTVANSLIPATLPTIFDQFSDLNLTIEVYNARTIRRLIHEFNLDVGIIIAHQKEVTDFVSIPLREDPIGVAIHSDHPFAKYPLHDPGILINERVLLREEASMSTKTFRSWCQKANIRCRFETTIHSTEAIKKALLANTGVAIVSKLAVEEELQSGRLIFKEIESTNRRSLYLIYHPERRLAPIQHSFIRLIQTLWQT